MWNVIQKIKPMFKLYTILSLGPILHDKLLYTGVWSDMLYSIVVRSWVWQGKGLSSLTCHSKLSVYLYVSHEKKSWKCKKTTHYVHFPSVQKFPVSKCLRDRRPLLDYVIWSLKHVFKSFLAKLDNFEVHQLCRNQLFTQSSSQKSRELW
mgnify:FL=1